MRSTIYGLELSFLAGYKPLMLHDIFYIFNIECLTFEKRVLKARYILA